MSINRGGGIPCGMTLCHLPPPPPPMYNAVASSQFLPIPVYRFNSKFIKEQHGLVCREMALSVFNNFKIPILLYRPINHASKEFRTDRNERDTQTKLTEGVVGHSTCFFSGGAKRPLQITLYLHCPALGSSYQKLAERLLHIGELDTFLQRSLLALIV